jgi:hypothetical protein
MSHMSVLSSSLALFHRRSVVPCVPSLPLFCLICWNALAPLLLTISSAIISGRSLISCLSCALRRSSKFCYGFDTWQSRREEESQLEVFNFISLTTCLPPSMSASQRPLSAHHKPPSRNKLSTTSSPSRSSPSSNISCAHTSYT